MLLILKTLLFGSVLFCSLLVFVFIFIYTRIFIYFCYVKAVSCILLFSAVMPVVWHLVFSRVFMLEFCLK